MAHFDAGADFNAEKMPVVDRMDAEYTIYVNNLPLELNEDAIRDIFSQYGTIVGMFHPRNATWVYITYGTFREAELAIRELDNKKPLYLKVTLAKERSMREEQKPNVSETYERSKLVNTADSSSVSNDIKHLSIDRGQSNASSKHAMPQITAHRSANYGLPVTCQSPYEIEDPYMNTNQLWTRGVITVTPDGRRHVSLGRGYTLYTYPERDPNIEELISKEYERRSDESYEYFKHKPKITAQDCSVCSTTTTKHCAKCMTYYCSKPCQMKDWPQHQILCERIPELVEETINDCKSSLQINQEVDQTKTSVSNVINKTTKASDLKLRRPNTLNAMQAENSSSTNVNINTPKKNNTDTTSNSVTNSTQKRHNQHDNVSQHTYVSQTKNADQPTVVNATNNTKEFSQHQMRKYNNNESPNHSRKNNSATYNSIDQSHHNNYQSDSKTRLSNVNKERHENNNIRDRTYNNDRNHSQKNGFQNNKSSVCYNRENTNRPGTESPNNTLVNNDLVAFYKDTSLSKTKFITVEVIITLKSNEYWIYKLEDADARKKLMRTLQNYVKTSRNVQPLIGEIYGVIYDTIWHRALVTSLNPTTVHFIDFGNYEVLEKDSIIKDIGDLIKSPKFARKIRLTQGTSDEYRNLQEGDQISVKMLSIDSDKTIIVEVEQKQSENLSSHTTENISNNAIKKFLPKENSEVASPDKSRRATVQIPNILNEIPNLIGQRACSEYEIKGYLQITASLRKNVYSATLLISIEQYTPLYEMIFGGLQEECKKIQISVNYKPKEGDIVCFWNDGWYRGYVLASLETSILSLDEAKIVSVDKVIPCPEKFSNIFTLGVICEINDPAAPTMITAEPYDFTAVLNEKNCEQDCLIIEIIINSKAIQAVLRPWKSTSNSLSPIELKSESKICLTYYQNHYNMYARSLENAAEEDFNHVIQSVARFAETAPHLIPSTQPIPNQVVIAPFEDGNSYRAIIIKIQNDKAQIVYIDFGNVAEIDIKDLKEMPECPLLYQHGCAGRIMLKDVPYKIPSNKEVDLYLRHLVGNEVPLICTFEGGSAKDGAYLTTLTGESINDKINQLLIPTWQRENDNDNTCYMYSDMEVASLGKVGDTVDALVLYVRKDAPSMYYMSPCDVNLLTHVFDVMPTMIKEYCEKMEYYIPRSQELCLAMYEGSWYRATCLNPKESCSTATILFVDYGNIETIEHKNIRLMPKEFFTPSIIGNMCTVVNLAPVDCNKKYSKAVQNKLDELVKENSKVKIKIVQNDPQEGNYKIELPEVHAELIKHGLL